MGSRGCEANTPVRCVFQPCSVAQLSVLLVATGPDLRVWVRVWMQVTVELKNELAIKGTLHSVDQYLNIKLHNTQVCTA